MAKNLKKDKNSGVILSDNGAEAGQSGESGINTEPEHVFFDKKDFIILLIIVLFSLALRIYGLSYPEKMYFDEVHYVPAARAYLTPDKMDPNDIHPPLAKEIMAAFMNKRFLGDTYVGWRAGSAAFGVLSVILMYFMGLSLFRNRFAAGMASFLLGIEFLHIVQSRIATLDMFLSFFIFLGYYFAWLYANGVPAGKFFSLKNSKENNKNGESRYQAKYAVLSAASFGLGISVKLSALGGAFGAFVFIIISMLLDDYKTDSGKNRIRDAKPLSIISAVFSHIKNFFISLFAHRKKVVMVCVIFAFFMTTMFLISHIPYFSKVGNTPNTSLKNIYEHLTYKRAFAFHYHQKFEHPYLSKMWQWPTVHRPIWYLWDKNSKTNTLNGIVAIGSLLFWWSFIPVLFDMIYRAFKFRDRRVIFILLGYLPLYLFWLSSTSDYGGYKHFKGGFFYYMLPCVPFMALGLTETLNELRDSRLGRVSIWIYTGGLVLLLAAFYPVLSGITIPVKYYDFLMKFNLFKSWV